jgi:hypothetical protein
MELKYWEEEMRKLYESYMYIWAPAIFFLICLVAIMLQIPK